MRMKNADTELYTDYLLSTFGAATATGLSAMLGGDVSHDRITRFLSTRAYTSRGLWHYVKPAVRAAERDECQPLCSLPKTTHQRIALCLYPTSTIAGGCVTSVTN